MRRFLRILLAGIYITTTFAVVANQAEAAGDELNRSKSSASPLQSDSDSHWATDPHFSHAKKTGADVEVSPGSVLWFTLTAALIVLHAFSPEGRAFRNPQTARAPPHFL